MSVSTIALSGWAQTADALQNVCPADTLHVDYAAIPSPEALFERLSTLPATECIVGWSLGGQLAARAVAQGAVRVKRMVLLGAPYCFRRKEEGDGGMPSLQVTAIRDAYALGASAMLAGFQTLLLLGDANPNVVKAALGGLPPANVLPHWGRWLDELFAFDADTLRGAHFPETWVVHGEQDAVIRVEQASHWQKLIPHAHVVKLMDCGHLPHLHAPEMVRDIVKGLHDHAL